MVIQRTNGLSRSGAPNSVLYTGLAGSSNGVAPLDTSCGAHCQIYDSDAECGRHRVVQDGARHPDRPSVGFRVGHADGRRGVRDAELHGLGDGGDDDLPPIAFLAGVNQPSGEGSLPEPTSMAIIGVGLAGVGVIRRRRAKAFKAN